MLPRNESQLKPEFLSKQNQNAFSGNDSASRKQMASGNYGQAVPLINAGLRDFITGTEVEYGKYQFHNYMPESGVIIDVIEDFVPPTAAGEGKLSTGKYVVYENLETGHYDGFIVPTYINRHKFFGAPLHATAAMNDLRPGMAIKKGTRFNTTSDHHDNGEIMVTRPARTAYMTLPGVLEDGMIISDRAAEEFGFYCYEKRIVNIGREYIPLDVYGSGKPGDPYKFAPDVGEFVNEKGILMGLRKHSSQWSSLDMTRDRLRRPNRLFDRTIKAPPGAEVVNIEVLHDEDSRQSSLPVGVADFIERYDQAKRRRNRRLIDVYKVLERDHGGKAPLSKRLHAEITSALNYNNPQKLPGRKLCYKREDLDEYRIVVTFRYKLRAGMAVKKTCNHGGKGVICEIRALEDMPKDQNGEYIDIAVDPMSLTKRMNMGKVIEPRLSSTSTEYTRLIRTSLNLPNKEMPVEEALFAVQQAGEEWVETWFAKLGTYYNLISPRYFKMMEDYTYEDKVTHLSYAVGQKVRVWLPTDNPVVYSDIHPELAANHPVNKGPLTFNTCEGIPVKTRMPVVVGNVDHMVLEKIARELSAVSSARILSNGVPGKMSQSDKGTTHIRTNTVRLPSETDLRWVLATMGGKAARDLQERGNAPEIHEELCESILTAPNPLSIQSAIPRDRFHMNHHRIAKQVKQLFMCNGVAISKKPTKTMEEVLLEKNQRA